MQTKKPWQKSSWKINSNYETGKRSAIIALSFLKSIVFLTPKKISILQKKYI
jgi:hypothetical protein